MIAALRSELRKTMTTRMWWVLLLTMVVYMAFLAGVMAFSFAFEPAEAAQAPEAGAAGLAPLDLALTVYTLAPTLGYVFPVIMGALSVSGEFRHMTVTPTLLAEPRRTVMLAAKLLAGLPIGLLYGVVGTLTTIGTGAAVLAALGEDPMLTDPEVLRTAAFAVLAMTVWAVVGVGFGAALKNQVVAVVVVLAFTQLVEPVLRVALGLVESLQEVPRWLPGAAGEAIAGSSFYSASGINELLPRGQGFAVLVGYALLLALVGRLTTLRKDIT